MSLKLGIDPERSFKNQMHNVAIEVVKLIDSQGIPVIHINPNYYHIELFQLSGASNPIRSFLRNWVLRRYHIKPFDLAIDHVKLGSAGHMRELVSLQVGEGSDQLRDIVYDLAKRLNIKRVRSFDPCVRIGRISKDLSDQEYHNLVNTIQEFNLTSISKVKFKFNGLSVLQSKDGQIKEIKRFAT